MDRRVAGSIAARTWVEFSYRYDPVCEDAADFDDSGTLRGLVDAVYLLRWTFQGNNGDSIQPAGDGQDQ